MNNKEYKLIDTDIFSGLIHQAENSPRKRINYNYHQLEDPVQRFLNVIHPGSYIVPHKHENPDKTETFIVLRGRLKFFIFNDEGNITDSFYLSPEHGKIGIDIAPKVWHTFIVPEDDTIIFEIKPGPYNKETDKNFASFAPAEDSPEAAAYLKYLQEY
jgi:cupin fold WbuC family metalloprotein